MTKGKHNLSLADEFALDQYHVSKANLK